MRTAPPRTTGGALGPDALKWLGAKRTCIVCGETEIIDRTTYTPNRKGLGGWSKICKRCERAR